MFLDQLFIYLTPFIPPPLIEALPQKNRIPVTLSVAKGLGMVGTI
ncbi:hypothetical protein ACFLWS_04410 [Chloroflexota bacterium]